MTEIPQDPVEARERGLVTATELSWALREVNRLSSEVDVQLAYRLSLRPLDHAALGHVMTAPVPLGPAELSARLGISTGSGTELVDRLERAGHLERRRDPTDRRRVALHVSPRAVGAVLTELAPLFASLDALQDELTPEEQAVVVRYLRGAADRLRGFLARPVDG